MEKCITDLIDAIKKVDDNYIKVIGFNVEDKVYQQAAENAFTAELYHQFKSIIENDKTGYYKNLQLHYDLTKMRFNGQRPDLVLHRAPDSRDIQRLYVEIKTCKSTIDYNSDFDKIFLATAPNNRRERLGYENAVFISVNSESVQVKQKIVDYISQNQLLHDLRLAKIYNVHIGDMKNITINKFSEI